MLHSSILILITQAFAQGSFLPELNVTLITLIPKQETLELISQFHPISLYNVVVKLMLKIIANWLKFLMQNLTSPISKVSYQVDRVLITLL